MKKRGDAAAYFLYQLINTGFLLGATLFCFSDLLGFPRADLRYLAALPVTVSLCFVIWRLNGKQRFYAAVTGVFVLLALFFSIHNFGIDHLSAGDSSLGSRGWLLFPQSVSDVVYAVKNNENLLPKEMAVIEWIRAFLLNIICYLLQLLMQKKLFLKLVLSVLAGGWLIYALFWGQAVPKAGVLFVLSYIALGTAEYRRMRQFKSKSGNGHRFALGIMPFVVLYFVLLAYMPVRKEPYDWQWAKSIYRGVEEKLTMYAENLLSGGDEYFGGNIGGFSGEGSSFSGFAGEDKEVLTLRIPNQTGMPVYLAGKVFDSFNGRQWESREAGISPAANLDVLETAYALETYQKEFRENAQESSSNKKNGNYLKTYQMEVRYEYLHTGYLLAPPKTIEIDGRERRVRYHREGADLKFDKKAGYGTEYLLRFCRMDMDRQELLAFLEWSGPELEQDGNQSRSQTGNQSGNQTWNQEEWEMTVKRYGEEGVSKDNLSLEALDQYRAHIKELYLPETAISPETEAWLSDITAGAETDMEKLQRIEAALAGMGYNTEPGKLPESVTGETSYLDYFLFDKQEGYCVHFATAFVLLARAEGFPARYVQGFCVPAVSGETPVYSDMAHAWPEVYIEGKGWIPFEPTPGYGQNRYILREDENGAEKAVLTENRKTQEPGSGSAAAEESLEESGPEKEKESRWLSYLGMIAGMLVIGSTLAFAADRLAEGYRDKKRSPEERYRLAVQRNLQILSLLGYGREFSQTYHELVCRIRSDAPAGGGIPYGFIETYENILYGTEESGEQAMQETLEDKERLLAALKRSKGRRYVLYRVRLYFIRYRN